MSLTLSSTIPYRFNYEFIGWSTKAPDGDNARVRFALYTDEATLEQVKQNYKQDGCGCMSEYVTKAIRYYTELHSLADCSHVVPDIIASTLKDITRESDNRQGRLLFKLAVELAILQNVVAANYGISKTDLERLRGICVNEVKKINGSITFDEAIRWQS